MNTGDVSVASAMAEAAREFNAPRDVQATLDSIVKVAAAQLPDIDHVSISIAHRDGRLETRAASDDLVLELDELQYELERGRACTAWTAATSLSWSTCAMTNGGRGSSPKPPNEECSRSSP